jgi:tRNA nucleotidyltransferase (CCA-adding enzyme)
MKTYLVGGAVRDQLLGLPIKEKDWVVVGSTETAMLAQGFRQVGKDFPVFLHPQTNEEYALARVERKTGAGYTAFQFDTAATVTLEEDLMRRDLTINAMALDSKGVLVDPYQGKIDLDKKILRHVSPAFAEDPVRILRVARFKARFASLGFKLAPETNALMQQMVSAGEVDALVAERVWKELERGLQETTPQAFFTVLENCHALAILFPEIKKHNIAALESAASLTEDAEIRFASLCHDLPIEKINHICERYRIPTTYRQLAVLVAVHYKDYLHAEKLSAEQLLDLLQAADAFRRPERFKKFLLASEALLPLHHEPHFVGSFMPLHPTPSGWLLHLYEAANTVDIAKITEITTQGPEIAAQIRLQRLDLIGKYLSDSR